MNVFNSLFPSFHGSTMEGQRPRHEDPGATVKPRYEINETEEAFDLTVDLPGVTKAGLEVTAEDDTLRIVGKRAWARPASWTSLHRETSDASFLLELEHDSSVELDQIRAELINGVLRVSLPKIEVIKPRKIAVA